MKVYRVLQVVVTFSKVPQSKRDEYRAFVDLVASRLSIWMNVQVDHEYKESKIWSYGGYVGEDGVGPLSDALSDIRGYEGLLVQGTKDTYPGRPPWIPAPNTSFEDAIAARKGLVKVGGKSPALSKAMITRFKAATAARNGGL